MKLTVHRLDYKNPTENNGYYPLPLLTSVNDITDANEVNHITAYFKTKEEAEDFKAKFPKSYNARLGGLSGDKEGYIFIVRFDFNTFWSNNSTGDKNETAIKRRDKVIAKIKSL